jgi:hypothetical protein
MSSADDALKNMIANLETRTGKSLTQWVAIAKKSGLARHGQIVGHLKAEHGLGHGYANLVAAESLGGLAAPSEDDAVTVQYAGAKAPLLPIYEALIAEVRKFGADVEIAPKKANVSLRRTKQFGLIQPSTATRIDLGINLKGLPPTGRLEKSGSFNAMVSHRVKLSSAADVNRELIAWLKQAYEEA